VLVFVDFLGHDPVNTGVGIRQAKSLDLQCRTSGKFAGFHLMFDTV
jgi:hypothetical protein